MKSRRILVPLIAAAIVCAGAGRRDAPGAAIPRRYVALGDSLTAGFAAGGLHRSGQLSGFAARLARKIGGAWAAFEQPLMSDPGIPGVLRLEVGEPPALLPAAGLGSPINLTSTRPYDNLAVPGARVADLLRTASDGGGLQDLVLRGLGTQLEQALLLEPDVVSLWVGFTDALGAAVSGIVLDGVTLTAAGRFADDFGALVQSLAAAGVEVGVVATIPHVGDLPFVAATPNVVFAEGGAVVDIDGARVPLLGPDGPLGSGDFVLLTATPLLARGVGVPERYGGSGLPLPDEAVLNRAEVDAIDARIDSYNAAIREAAADVGFAVADAGALFEQWRTAGAGAGYSQAAAFSLDGIHPSPLGHRLLARLFGEAIDEAYGSRIAGFEPEATAATLEAETATTFPSGPFVFTRQAARSLRFGLGVPRPARLLRMKRRRLERLREPGGRERQRVYELPAEPVLAGGPGRQGGSAPAGLGDAGAA